MVLNVSARRWIGVRDWVRPACLSVAPELLGVGGEHGVGAGACFGVEAHVQVPHAVAVVAATGRAHLPLAHELLVGVDLCPFGGGHRLDGLVRRLGGRDGQQPGTHLLRHPGPADGDRLGLGDLALLEQPGHRRVLHCDASRPHRSAGITGSHSRAGHQRIGHPPPTCPRRRALLLRNSHHPSPIGVVAVGESLQLHQMRPHVVHIQAGQLGVGQGAHLHDAHPIELMFVDSTTF
jgi:hypothetical protein